MRNNSNSNGNYEISDTKNNHAESKIDIVMPFEELSKLYFTNQEIDILINLVGSGYKITPMSLKQLGFTHEEVSRMKYMYDIVTGRITIESLEDFRIHLRKLYGKHQRIGIGDLLLSRVTRVPRKAVVAGIKDKTYCIYNSKRYLKKDWMYDVEDVTSSNIVIRTKRKPVLKHGESKMVQGVIEIKSLNKDGTVSIAINKEYCRLCNRFIVVASLKRPEHHHGMVEITCMEGTRVFIYAQTMKNGETPNYKGGTQRIYDFGYYTDEIYHKVLSVASELYKKVHGVYAVPVEKNSDFVIVSKEEKEEKPEII